MGFYLALLPVRYFCLLILFNLQYLKSPFPRLQGHSSSCFCSLCLGRVGPFSCVGFLMGGTGACVLVGGAESFPSDE